MPTTSRYPSLLFIGSVFTLKYEFTKIVLLSETSGTPTCLIGDLSETDMLNRRPTCLIGDPSETDISDQRPKCPIVDLLPDHRPCNVPIWILSIKYTKMSIFIYKSWWQVSDGSLKKCRSPMALQLSMLFSYQACWSQISHVSLRRVCN